MRLVRLFAALGVVLCGVVLFGSSFADQPASDTSSAIKPSKVPPSSSEADMKEFVRKAGEYLAKHKNHTIPVQPPATLVFLNERSRTVTNEDGLFKVVDATVSAQTMNPKGLAEDSTLLDPSATRSSLTLRRRVTPVQSSSPVVQETVFTFKNENSAACYVFDPVFFPKSEEIVFKLGRVDFESDFFFGVYVFNIQTKTVRVLNDIDSTYSVQTELSPETGTMASYLVKEKALSLVSTNISTGKQNLVATVFGNTSALSWSLGQGLVYDVGRAQRWRKPSGKINSVERRDTYVYQPSVGKSRLLREDAYSATLSPDGRYLAYNTRLDDKRTTGENNAVVRLTDLTTKRTATIGKLAGYAPHLDTTLWGIDSHLYLFHCVWGDTETVNKVEFVPSKLHLYSFDPVQGKADELGAVDFSSPREGVNVFPIAVSNGSLLYAIRAISSNRSPLTTLRARDFSVWSFDPSTKKNTLVWKDSGQFSWSFNTDSRNVTVRYIQ